MPLPGSTLPAEYDQTALVPGPGGGLMIGDVNPDAGVPTFAPNPMGGPPIMIPPPAPMVPNLPLRPGSVPTGEGPIPGIASTQGLAAPRALPALGPNAAPLPVAEPPPGAPGAPGAAPGAPGGLPVAAPGAAPRPARGGGAGPGARPAAAPDALQQDITKIGAAEEAGIQKTQEAKTEAADRLTRATSDLAVQQRMDAQELQDRQETYRAAQVHMEEQERGALQKARDYTIPDFWQGREGARIGSVISIAMGNIASSITGGPNGAMTIINKNVDDYFHRQKEKVDNLYKYAEQTGRLNERTRMRYAQELTGLQAQHLAVQQSIITRIESVKAGNQGMVDAASTDELLAKAKADQAKRVQDYRTNQAHLSLMGAQTSAAKASAAHSYAEAGLAKAKAAAKGPDAPQDEKLAVRDPATGQTVGYAPTARQTQTIAQGLNAGKLYIESLQKLKADVEQVGHVKDPFGVSDAAKNRTQLFNDAVAKGRTARGLGVSNANLALEHGAFGGAGVGLQRMITPQVIDNMIKDARDKSEGTIRTLTPVRGAAPVASQPAAAAPGQIPVGARATSGGKPIVMTASGWALAQ